MSIHRLRRYGIAFIVLVLVLWLSVTRVWCRLVVPPSMVDVRELAEKSPIVFRGRVVAVTSIQQNLHEIKLNSTATFQVDRLYRGITSAQASLRFVYVGSLTGANGHDCIDFQPDTYWLVFAVEKNGNLELFDDCSGALAISPLLGPDLRPTGWLAQMEADFLAGLGDQDSEARLASIQRLGGLKLPSSRDALHRVVESGNEAESKWAVYAALRTGDVSVLPRVQRLLAINDSPEPERAIAFELRNITDPASLPDLISILESAPGELTRTRVLIALGEELNDPRAVPSLAAHLSDPDLHARYDALDGLRNITKEPECTLPSGWKEQDIEPQILRCQVWWKQIGKLREWSQN